MNEKNEIHEIFFFNLLLLLSLILSNLNISSILETSEFGKKKKRSYSVKRVFYISCLHSKSPLSC